MPLTGTRVVFIRYRLRCWVSGIGRFSTNVYHKTGIALARYRTGFHFGAQPSCLECCAGRCRYKHCWIPASQFYSTACLLNPECMAWQCIDYFAACCRCVANCIRELSKHYDAPLHASLLIRHEPFKSPPSVAMLISRRFVQGVTSYTQHWLSD